MAVFQLLYASGATRPLGVTDIDSILAASRRNNAALGVTGMLLHAEGSFIQVLEGDRRTVRVLADRISTDERHRNFMVLYEGEAESRAFSQWEMGFKTIDRDDRQEYGIFLATSSALENRIDRIGNEIVLDMIKAFGRDFVAG